MELAWKPDLDEAVRHWEAFWNHEVIDRPCLSVVAPKEGREIPPAPPYMDGADGDFAGAVARWEARAEHLYYAGDAIPHIVLSFGPDQFGAFLGADLERSDESRARTSWAVPFVEDWNDALPIRLDPGARWWAMMLEFMRVAGDASQGKYLAGMLDLHSNLDALASIREPADVATDLLDCPDLVHRAMADVRGIYPKMYEALYEAGRMEGRGSIGWISYYSPKRFAVMQCDFAIMVSPQHFDTFILPALEDEANFLDHSVYHYDGPGALAHLDSVLGIRNLDSIQWVPGAGNKPQHEWTELLLKIQEAGKSVHLAASPDQCKQLHKILDPSLVFYQTSAKSEKEADELVEWFVRNT